MRACICGRIFFMLFLPQDTWEIRDTSLKGRGVFAKKDIPAGTVIGDYVGRVIKTAEENTIEEENGFYLMYYHDYASIYPTDIAAPGVHLINHSCAPNCWMYVYHGHTLFFAVRKIFAGEELLISYLLNPDKKCIPCTHVCNCEYPNCTHTMHMEEDLHEKWSKVNNAQEKATKRMRIRYGKELPLLSSYPTSVRDNKIYTLIGSLQESPLTLDITRMPTVREVRAYVRESGRVLELPSLKLRILGVLNEELILEPL